MRSVAVAGLLAVLAIYAGATACPTGYAQVVTINIVAQSGLSGDLTNFPMYFSGVKTFAQVANGGFSQSSTGLDIVFCDALSSGNLLDYELVTGTYTTTTGVGEWWVNVPTVSKTLTKQIFAFVGKAGASDLSNPTGLWSTYALVMHFGTASTLTLTDSTGNNTPVNHGATAVAGEFNGGANFVSGSSQWIDTGVACTSITAFTVEEWVYLTSATNTQFLTSCRDSGGVNGVMMYKAAGNEIGGGDFNSPNFFIRFSTQTIGTNGPFVSFAESHIAGSSNQLTMYQNGALPTTSTANSGTVTDPGNASNWVLGRDGANATPNYYDGRLDEIRISKSTRSTDWIAAEYTNQNSPGSFYYVATIYSCSGKCVQYSYVHSPAQGGTWTITSPQMTVTAGNHLELLTTLGNGAGIGTVTISDTFSSHNTYTTNSNSDTGLNGSLFGGTESRIYHADNITGGTGTITWSTTNTGSGYGSLYIGEFTGIINSSSYDNSAHAATSGANPSLAVTNTFQPDLMFSCVETDAGTNPAYSNLTDISPNFQSGSPVCGFTSTSATGSFTATTSGGTSGNYIMSIESAQETTGALRHKGQVF